jgi:hypothetical protein
MRRLALALVTSVLAVSATAADNAGKDAGQNAAPDAAAMAKMMELMKPGAEHQQLAKMIGTWDVDAKLWMDPKAPPTESKATAQFTSVYEGRYIKQDFQGDMMGMPYSGTGYEGFDRGLGVYTAVWMDSMSTGMFTQTGKASADGKTITYGGEMYCPQTNGPIKARSVMTRVSDDELTYEMFVTQNGHEDKSMELHYHRKAAAK